jgi:hypothetical protein
MKATVVGSALIFLALGISCAQAQNVNVIGYGDVRPGVYGRVEIGYASPPLLYDQPVVVTRGRRTVVAPASSYVLTLDQWIRKNVSPLMSIDQYQPEEQGDVNAQYQRYLKEVGAIGQESAVPVYLHVPRLHAEEWSKYCQRYGACNRPVFFVKSAEYEPGYYRRSRSRD